MFFFQCFCFSSSCYLRFFHLILPSPKVYTATTCSSHVCRTAQETEKKEQATLDVQGHLLRFGIGTAPPKTYTQKITEPQEVWYDWMSKGKDSNHQCTNMSEEPTKDSTEMVQQTFVQKGVSSRVFPKVSAILGTTEDQLRPALRCLVLTTM